MKDTPRSVVEHELETAGIRYTCRIGKNCVYHFEGLSFVASRAGGRGGRTIENTRAGIKRMIRQLTGEREPARLSPVARSGRNGAHHEDDQTGRPRP